MKKYYLLFNIIAVVSYAEVCPDFGVGKMFGKTDGALEGCRLEGEDLQKLVGFRRDNNKLVLIQNTHCSVGERIPTTFNGNRAYECQTSVDLQNYHIEIHHPNDKTDLIGAWKLCPKGFSLVNNTSCTKSLTGVSGFKNYFVYDSKLYMNTLTCPNGVTADSTTPYSDGNFHCLIADMKGRTLNNTNSTDKLVSISIVIDDQNHTCEQNSTCLYGNQLTWTTVTINPVDLKDAPKFTTDAPK